MERKVPVYEDIKQQLKARIENGEWASGQRIPSEYELVEELAIGRHRARQALRELEVEGYIVRRRGSGSYVVPASDRTTAVNVAGRDAVAMFFPRYICRYSRQVVDGFMRHMTDTGRRIIMYNVCSDEASERESLRAIVDSGVAGLVAWIDHDTPAVRKLLSSLAKRCFPIVLADRYLPGVDIDHAVSSNEDIGYRLTRALLDNGHQRIAFAGYRENVSSIADRFSGYQRALREAGLVKESEHRGTDGRHNFLLEVESVMDFSEQTVKGVMALRDRPTAFVCVNDLFAEKVYQQLVKLGYEVPGDVELAAVDDEHPLDTNKIPMICIAQNAYEVGAQSAQVLLARVTDPNLPIERRSIQAGPLYRK